MCHAYSITTNVEAIRQMVRDMFDFDVAANIGNLPPQTGVYPDMLAPIIRNQPGFRELVKVRWGMPSSSRALYRFLSEARRACEPSGFWGRFAKYATGTLTVAACKGAARIYRTATRKFGASSYAKAKSKYCEYESVDITMDDLGKPRVRDHRTK